MQPFAATATFVGVTREELDDLVDDMGLDGLLVADGFDDAILGLGQRYTDGGTEYFVTYDEDKIIDILEAQGMDTQEAYSYYSFNVTGAYVGPRMPAFVMTR